MSLTGVLSPADLPPPSVGRVPHPSRGDGWNPLADVEVSNANGGFQITAPADTTVKTLNLYLEISGGAEILQTSLSDGSAPPITDQSVTDLDFASKIYSIDFRAASSGQTLTVNFSAAHGATIGLQAAALTSSSRWP